MADRMEKASEPRASTEANNNERKQICLAPFSLEKKDLLAGQKSFLEPAVALAVAKLEGQGVSQEEKDSLDEQRVSLEAVSFEPVDSREMVELEETAISLELDRCVEPLVSVEVARQKEPEVFKKLARLKKAVQVADVVDTISVIEADPECQKETEESTKSQYSKEDEPKKKPNKGKRGGNRCGDCDGCRRQEDCKECIYCKDKKGNGGPGVLKQCCKLKKCTLLKGRAAKSKTKCLAAELPTSFSATSSIKSVATSSLSLVSSTSAVTATLTDVTTRSEPSVAHGPTEVACLGEPAVSKEVGMLKEEESRPDKLEVWVEKGTETKKNEGFLEEVARQRASSEIYVKLEEARGEEQGLSLLEDATTIVKEEVLKQEDSIEEANKLEALLEGALLQVLSQKKPKEEIAEQEKKELFEKAFFGGKETVMEENDLNVQEVKQELLCHGTQTPENRKKSFKYEKWEMTLTKGETLKPFGPPSVPDELKKFMCYICNIFPRVGSANRSELYRHYASKHYKSKIKHDFGYDSFDFVNNMCPDCGIVLKRERFIDHMGVKHSKVEHYLPEQYHLREGQYLQSRESSAWLVSAGLVRSRKVDKDQGQVLDDPNSIKTKNALKKFGTRKDKHNNVLSSLQPGYNPKTKSQTSGRSGAVQKSSIYNQNGSLLHSSLDLCDCLKDSCPGCHLPCPKCMSPKCGHVCRCGRKWQYHSVQLDGVPDSMRLNNHLLPTCK